MTTPSGARHHEVTKRMIEADLEFIATYTKAPQPRHRRFSRCAKSGVWEKVFQHLAIDKEYAMIDSTIVRAHQHSAGAQKKPARTRRSDGPAAD